MAVARSCLVVTLALAVSACQTTTDGFGRTVYSTPTLGQMLGGRPQPTMAAGAADQRVVRGHMVAIVAASGGHQIVADGRVLATDTVDDQVVFKGVYEGGGRAYVLVEEQSGGTACPSLFQAVDVNGAVPVVSPQFGNCSDIPRVSIASGALVVSVPGFRAAPATRVTFRDGRLGH